MSRATGAAAAAGALFGAGLALSGMTDARRVLGFLDIAGDFDPTLVWVLGSALLVSAVVFSFFDSTRVLAAFSSGVAVLAIIDALIRQRQLNFQYGSPDA